MRYKGIARQKERYREYVRVSVRESMTVREKKRGRERGMLQKSECWRVKKIDYVELFWAYVYEKERDSKSERERQRICKIKCKRECDSKRKEKREREGDVKRE